MEPVNMTNSEDGSKRKKRKAIRYTRYRWTNRRVPYEISNEFSKCISSTVTTCGIQCVQLLQLVVFNVFNCYSLCYSMCSTVIACGIQCVQPNICIVSVPSLRDSQCRRIFNVQFHVFFLIFNCVGVVLTTCA